MKATLVLKFTLLLFFVSVIHPTQSHAVSNKVRIDGELEIFIEDYKDGTHKTRKYLKKDKKRVELKGNIPEKLKTGDKISVKGSFKNENTNNVEMLVEDGSTQVFAIAATTPTTGDQKTAVFLVNWSDDQSQPFTAAQVSDLVFSTMNNYYKEASFQKTSVSGNVFGYFTVKQSTATCDAYAMASEVESLATNSGVNLANYPRKIYFFPRSTGCGWSGLGNVGGTTTRSWVNGSLNMLVVGHEFGHNLGLHHAKALNCDISALGNTCTTLQYGDAADLMGNIRAGHFNPFYKEQLGWLASTQLITASTSGRYHLEPYSSNTLGPKAIRIPRGNNQWYYLEYRQPIGFDSVLNLGTQTKGLMIRSAVTATPTSSLLLDMTPQTSTNTTTELADGALIVGATYYDATANLSITLVSADASSAVIDISLGGQVVAPEPTPAPEPAPAPAPSDALAPVVSIASPSVGVIVAARTTITIESSATDNVAVTRIDTYVNGSLTCSSSASSQSCRWKVPGGKNKTFNIEVRAFDAAGNMGNKFTSAVSK